MNSTRQWDRMSFEGELKRNQGLKALAIFREWYRLSTSWPEVYWEDSVNRIDERATLWPWIKSEGSTYYPPVCFRLDGQVEVPFLYLKRTFRGPGATPFELDARREELQRRLSSVPGIAFAKSGAYRNGKPSFRLQLLANTEAMNRLSGVFVWYLNQFQAGDAALPAEPNRIGYFEGDRKAISVNAYGRSEAARQACIAHHGTACAVCGMRLEEIYGQIAQGLIHVHHLRELGAIRRGYVVDPVRDLQPLCPNCHAVLHWRKPAPTIEELKALLVRR